MAADLPQPLHALDIQARRCLTAASATAAQPCPATRRGPDVEQGSGRREAGSNAGTDPKLDSRQGRAGDLGDAWPLTMDAGLLDCHPGGRVMFTGNGKTYALNGTAKSAAAASDWDANINEIWANDAAWPGTKKSMGPLLDRGLALCQ
jgi:hypothetical protein